MLRVLAYHRVAEMDAVADIDNRSISASPRAFRQQMRHIARNYHCVPMPEVLDAVERGVQLPRRPVLITFDDAYRDFAEIAWPILRECGLSATLFVPTGFPDRPERVFWWDRLHRAFLRTSRVRPLYTPFGTLLLTTNEQRLSSLRLVQREVTNVASDKAMEFIDWLCAELSERPTRQSPVLTWDELRQLANDGVTLGSHTQTHPIVTWLSPEKMRQEIRGSQQDLQREIGAALPIFCYPNGNHSEEIAQLLKDEGIKVAFTTIPSPNELETSNLLRLGRTCVTPRTDITIFSMRLLAIGVRADAWRHRKLKATLTRTAPRVISRLCPN